MRDAFIDVRCDAGGFRVAGDAEFSTGHRILRPDGTVDGVHAAWRWTGSALTIEQDRYGLWPLFYFTTPGRVCLATSIPTLLRLGAPAHLDEAALAVFLRVGFFLGDSTALSAVKALPPAASVECRNGQFLVTGSRPQVPRRHIGRDEAIDAYLELFTKAIARRASEAADSVVPLSGGRDSRHIALALHQLGAAPRYFVTVRHFPPRNDDDLLVAALIARTLRVPHVRLEQPSDQLTAELEKNLHTSFCSDEHVQMLPVRTRLQGVPAIYDGIGGDVLSAGLFLRPEAVRLCGEGDTKGLTAFILTGYDNQHVERGMTAILSAEGLRRFSREKAERSVRAELETHLEAPDPVSSFFFWNRTRREIALVPYALLSNVPAAFAPYLDYDVYALLASLPVSLTADKQLHTDAIARGYPNFAHVPFGGAGTPRRSPASFRRLAVKAAGYLERRRLDCFNHAYFRKSALVAFVEGSGDRLWFLPRVVCVLQLMGVAQRSQVAARHAA